MILIIGLGNPGKKFKKTRLNVGFMVLDKLQKSNSFSDWKIKKKYKAEISEGILAGKKIILAKPWTFMNESGKSVKVLFNFYNTARTVLVVIHDDLDLPLGKMKIVKNRGSAGHKGVQSIIDEIGTKNFIRFRLGIKPSLGLRATEGEAKQSDGTVYQCEKFVLGKLTKEEEGILNEVIEKTCQAVKMMVKEGTEKTMTKFNQ